jgi:hypothetical protein
MKIWSVEINKPRREALSAVKGEPGFAAGSLFALSRFLKFPSLANSRGKKWRDRFRGRALKDPLGPALHKNNLNNYGYNKNGADYRDRVIVHGPLPV